MLLVIPLLSPFYVYPHWTVTISTLLKVKRYISPITGPRCPEGSRKFRFRDYVTMAQDGGKVVSLTHRALFTPRKFLLVLISVRGLSRPHGHSAIGRILTSSGIEPATFRFVAQRLNHCATAVPILQKD